MACRPNPMPFKAALQHDAGPTAAHIESQPEVDHKFGTRLPIAADEELVDFRLRARFVAKKSA
jgi:hypothetical protein